MRAGDMYICEGDLNRGAPEAADSEMVDKSQDAQTPADSGFRRRMWFQTFLEGARLCVPEIGYDTYRASGAPCEGIRRRLTREHEHG
jgi:hypothetical protein